MRAEWTGRRAVVVAVLCGGSALLAAGALAQERAERAERAGQAGAAAELPAASGPSLESPPSLESLKAWGARHSIYRTGAGRARDARRPEADLKGFGREVRPVLTKYCVECHGPQQAEGNIRIDQLDPDLLRGKDVSWWLEVLAVLSKGEMPPADAAPLSDGERSKVVEWLTAEIQLASVVRRAEGGHSSFRRMTRYEYNFALQDLLGLPLDFARDLPPEATSEDGFHNSSEVVHMSASQFATYRELGRAALRRATVRGPQPKASYWGVSMESASAADWARQDEQLEKIRQQFKDDPQRLEQELQRREQGLRGRHNAAYYEDLSSGRTVRASWSYPGARYAWKPVETLPEPPAEVRRIAVIPAGQKLIIELGDSVPDEGMLRVRVRASRASLEEGRTPSMQLEFGWQASNDSHASVRVSQRDIAVQALPGSPQTYQWEIPLSEIYPRNSVRGISKLGDLPSPSEYVKLVNSSVSPGDIRVEYVEVAAPVYDHWPPNSHQRILGPETERTADELADARRVLERFMSRAWRRPVTKSEVEQKLSLFQTVRPVCVDFQEAVIEVLATVLASPKFLYLQQVAGEAEGDSLSSDGLATRLAIFLWCSVPDESLRRLGAEGQLDDPQVLAAEVERMLADPRSRRFSEQFVRQWLGMQLLDYLKVDRRKYPQFDPALKEAMAEEPVSFFHEVLRTNGSLLDLLHADYTMANERLARHYGLDGVYGNEFRRVSLGEKQQRGGLLTQAGLLAMNSDGKDSHPLKRGIWTLERILNDPPPPPPAAVPRIDLADPEIAKLTLKQRIENHRDQAACRSCHAKIDPWGIAFENFDAVGGWRTEIDGQPVDASSLLFDQRRLEGMDGLKRLLLEERQDQFVRALVHKMVTFALGRPLTFGDRASVDRITAEVRQRGDGLATMVQQIVASDLFHSQ